MMLTSFLLLYCILYIASGTLLRICEYSTFKLLMVSVVCPTCLAPAFHGDPLGYFMVWSLFFVLTLVSLYSCNRMGANSLEVYMFIILIFPSILLLLFLGFITAYLFIMDPSSLEMTYSHFSFPK